MMAARMSDDDYVMIAEVHADRPTTAAMGRQTTMGEVAIARGLLAIARAITAHTATIERMAHEQRRWGKS